MATEALGIVRELFDRLADGRLDDAIALFADDAVMVIPPSMSAEPDVYRGAEGARRYMAGFQGQLEGVRFEPTEMVEEGGRVLVGFALTGRGATSGIEVTQSGAGAVWVRDGLITRMEGHPDLEAARSAPRDPPPC